MIRNKQAGVLWLTPANYDRAVALSDDGMPASYEAWREKIDRVIGGLPAGVEVVRVEVDPDEVAAWCRANGRKVDTNSRSAFAAAYLQRKMEN